MIIIRKKVCMTNLLQEQLEQLKKQSAAEVTAPAAQQTANTVGNLKQDLFSYVNPTELVEIPSEGKFYSPEHPLHNKNTIEIRQMTAKEEDILTNKSFIKKGVVIDRLLQSIIVDKSIDPASLLVGDRNAIMVAARIGAYGPKYDIALICTKCYAKEASYVDLTEVQIDKLEEVIQKVEKLQDIKHVRMQNGNVVVQLPKSKWFAECRLLTGKNEKQLLDYIELKKKKDSTAELELSEQLLFIVESINTVTETEKIVEAIKLMPAYDAKFLRDKYQQLVPNVSIKKKFSCSSCEAEQEVEVPFTQEFFWPK